MANTMEILLQQQLSQYNSKLMADGLMTEEQFTQAQSLIGDMMKTINIPVAAPRTRKVKEVAAEDRCMARVWGGGEGCQCKSSKVEGSDYCKRCQKLADVTETPLQFSEDGKHIGLFWGRFDQPKPHFCDGMLVCQWKSPDSKAIVQKALSEGKTFHPFSGEAKKKSRTGSTKSRKPRAKKASKKAIRSQVPRAKNAYMFFLAEKRPQVRADLEALAAENPTIEKNEKGEDVSIIQKVPVSEVAKQVGALWKALDDEAKAPYNAMAAKAKEERNAKIAEMEEQLSAAVASDDNGSIASEEKESSPLTHANVAKHTATVAAAPKISQFDHTDPITATALKGINDKGEVDESASVSDVTESVQESVEDEEEGEEVEEHELADGTTVLKGDDGTIYDAESCVPIGKWNEADNSLIKA